MAEKIKLVQGDTRPQIKVNLTDDTTGLPVDISGAVVHLKFRAAGDATVLSTLSGTVVDGPNGSAVFSWPAGALDVAAGDYEGEIEVTFADTTIQTVYDTLKFKVREQF